MLRYKITLIIFIFLSLTVLLLNLFCCISQLFLIFPFVFLLTVLITASFVIKSQFYLRAICKGSKNNQEVALTFDDGPDKAITPKILEILKKYDVHATFFCIGKKINGNQDLLLKIHRAGHLIANHTYSHSRLFGFITLKKMIEELEKTNESIFQITGEKPIYFRPPHGVTNPTIKHALQKFSFTTIGWSIRSFDTVISSKEKVLKRVLQKVKSGDIILFHDTVNNCPENIDGFISAILNKGFKILRLDHLINKKSV